MGSSIKTHQRLQIMAGELITFQSLYSPTREVQPWLTLATPNKSEQINGLDGNGLSLGSIKYGNVPLNQSKQNSGNDPWQMKKDLTNSDIGNLSRLLLHKQFVKQHVLPNLRENLAQELSRGAPVNVKVYDRDQNTTHWLVFKYWKDSQHGYVLQEKWKKIFVNGRGLKQGDTIGLYWDGSMFVFSVLQRAACR